MDNSPPNLGVVSDGKALDDIEYQSIRWMHYFEEFLLCFVSYISTFSGFYNI